MDNKTQQKPEFKPITETLRDVELKVAQDWRDNEIFEKSVKRRRRGKPFVFFDGPPTANGLPHVGHFLTRIYKDLFGRYKTMQGFYAPRRAGWDTHGLPVELEIEKELGLKNKKDIEAYGIANFNIKCRESVWKYKKAWEEMTERIGFWIDLKNPYITYQTDYVESLWWIINQIWSRGLLYQGHKILPYCTRCGTSLSSHEVAQGYKDVVDTSAFVKFRLRRDQSVKDIVSTDLPIYVLAWTTTPWTLPGNVALAVGASIEYSIVNLEASGDVVIVATERLDVLKSDYKVLGKLKGKDLVGLKYDQIFEVNDLKSENSHKIYAGEFVSTTDGTGVVHIAPMYGEDDYALGRQYDLPMKHTVNEQGNFNDNVLEFSRKPARESNQAIIDFLKENNALYRIDNYEHSYPHCWRCKTPLLYYAKSSWFIEMSKLRKQLAERNKTINWNPSHLRDGRFGEFIKEAKDWALSRERYWGTPLPLWKCSSCGDIECVDSLNKLEERRIKKGNQYFLVRHAYSDRNKSDIVASRIEHDKYNLTDNGIKKMKSTARDLRLKGGLDMIFSSPFMRTRQTAQILADEMKIENVVIDERLKELDHGSDLEGKPHKECPICHDSISLDTRLFDGETRREAKARMMNFVRDCERKFDGKRIAVVSHGDPIWLLEAGMKNLDDKEVYLMKDKIYPKEGEVIKLALKNYPYNDNGEVDPHRPYIDSIEMSCSKCNGVMKRIPELIDVWFDSGAMPYAQWHYPFENKDLIDGKGNTTQYPADFIVEAIDQTRGWFYTLLAISALLDRPAPYRNVSVLGFVTNEKGKKLSKSEGAGEGFSEILSKTSVDALRWYLYTVSDVGDDKRFSLPDVENRAKNFHMIVLNMARFFELYRAKSVKSVPRAIKPKNALDKWVWARCMTTLSEVTEALDGYNAVKASRAIESFVINDVSQWWLRMSRPRFQHPEDGSELLYSTKFFLSLWIEIAKMLAPFNPFFAEYLSEELQLSASMKNIASIHHADWSKVKAVKIADVKIIKEMEDARAVISAGLAQRKKSQIKVRQPLQAVDIKRKVKFPKDIEAMIRAELNIKDVFYKTKLEEIAVLDEKLSPELINEGYVREVVRGVQDLRKEIGCGFQEKVSLVWHTTDENLGELIDSSKKEISKATLLKEMTYSKSQSGLKATKDIVLSEGVAVTVSLK